MKEEAVELGGAGYEMIEKSALAQALWARGQSYGEMGANAMKGLRCCLTPGATLDELREFATRAFGMAAGSCAAVHALPKSAWALEHGQGAPAAKEVARLGLDALNVALTRMGASAQEREGVLGEFWAHSSRFTLMDCAGGIKNKLINPKKTWAWLVEELVEEGSRQEWAPAIALAHLSALTRGALSPGRASVRGWSAPWFREDVSWGFHVGALEWALDQSARVDLDPALLEQALSERVDIFLEGDPERQDQARARMSEIKARLERAQMSMACAPAAAPKRSSRL
jgi:hypothetical protein